MNYAFVSSCNVAAWTRDVKLYVPGIHHEDFLRRDEVEADAACAEGKEENVRLV
jgi:hypothetical protein